MLEDTGGHARRACNVTVSDLAVYSVGVHPSSDLVLAINSCPLPKIISAFSEPHSYSLTFPNLCSVRLSFHSGICSAWRLLRNGNLHLGVVAYLYTLTTNAQISSL